MFLSFSIRYYEMTLVTLKTLFLDLEFFRARAMSYSSLCFHAVCLEHQRFSHISSLSDWMPRWFHSHLPDVIYFVRLGFFSFVHFRFWHIQILLCRYILHQRTIQKESFAFQCSVFPWKVKVTFGELWLGNITRILLVLNVYCLGLSRLAGRDFLAVGCKFIFGVNIHTLS